MATKLIGCCPKPTQEESIAAIEKLGGVVILEPLVGVDFSGSQVTDAGLAHLKGLALELLGLNGTKITGAGLVHLEGLTKLEYLNLQNTKVTDAGVEKLQAVLPKCKIYR